MALIKIEEKVMLIVDDKDDTPVAMIRRNGKIRKNIVHNTSEASIQEIGNLIIPEGITARKTDNDDGK